MDYIVLFIFAMWVGYSVGELDGGISAQKAMHRGEVQCQTLPDQKIVCWKVTDVK